MPPWTPPLAAVDGQHPLLLLVGLLLAVSAMLAARGHRSLPSLTALFLAAGLLVSPMGLGLVELDGEEPWLAALATVTLVLILFKDGVEVDAELTRERMQLPVRALLLALPLTIAGIVLAAVALGLTLTQAFVLGALLAPTDPVLSSGVVDNPRVPARLRHALRLEAGLNDGLALPFVLIGVSLLSGSARTPVEWAWWTVQDLSLGVVYGLLFGWLASRCLPKAEEHFQVLYGFGAALITFAATGLLPHGNGFIAAFVCATTLGWRRPATQGLFAHRSDEVLELLKMATFVIVGAFVSAQLVALAGWSGLAIGLLALFVVRPLAVLLAFARTDSDYRERLFIGWFGPRGVATVAFALLVLPHDERLFAIATMTVCLSVILHGLTDEWGAHWVGRHSPDEDDGDGFVERRASRAERVASEHR